MPRPGFESQKSDVPESLKRETDALLIRPYSLGLLKQRGGGRWSVNGEEKEKEKERGRDREMEMEMERERDRKEMRDKGGYFGRTGRFSILDYSSH